MEKKKHWTLARSVKFYDCIIMRSHFFFTFITYSSCFQFTLPPSFKLPFSVSLSGSLYSATNCLWYSVFKDEVVICDMLFWEDVLYFHVRVWILLNQIILRISFIIWDFSNVSTKVLLLSEDLPQNQNLSEVICLMKSSYI